MTHRKVTGNGIDAELVLEQIEQADGFKPMLNEDDEITVVEK